MTKRVFDLVGALALLVVLVPIFGLIAVALKCTNWSVPVVTGVRALGKGRKPFFEWKFSTMVPDAQERLEEILAKNPKLREEWEQTYKLKDDPRILPGVGHFLRKTSLNELPQLINVLMGEMSLVGPRAITEREEALYASHSGKDALTLRYSVRPGITGLWQVEGRSDIPYEERVRLDRLYIQNRNFLTDLRILVKTAYKVVRPSGAY